MQVSAGDRPELPTDRARCPRRLANLLRRMWAQDPRHRPGAADVLKQLGIILHDGGAEPEEGEEAEASGGSQLGATDSETKSAGGSGSLGSGPP